MVDGGARVRYSGYMANAHDDVKLEERWLSLPLGDVRPTRFHLRWLRHACDQDRHPTTGERTVCSSELPDDLRAASARLEGEALIVEWAHDGRVSRYARPWLREHAYDREGVASPSVASRVEAWGSTGAPVIPSDVGEVEISGVALDEAVERSLPLLARRGVAVVRAAGWPGRPEDQTETLLESFADRGLAVVGTHFGRIEDLRTDNTTNANTDQLGYTDAAIELHTDQPFLDRPPRYQLLQSIRVADAGGESYLVDALAAARRLAWEDRAAFETLLRTPVVFHRKQRQFERIVVSPILSGVPEAFQVRYSYFTMAPHRLPFDQMEAFYRAYDRFARLVRNPKNQLRLTLRPGDFLIYDNYRMLHARTGFRGPRWVRGVYFDPAEAA